MKSSPNHKQRSSSILLLLAAAATAAVVFALRRGWEPGVPGEWVWSQNRTAVNLLPALGAATLLVLVIAALCRTGRWERLNTPAKVFCLLALVGCIFLLQLTLLNAVGTPWVAPATYILSPNTTTYFQVSLGITSPQEWIEAYPSILATLPYHAATHPPGLALFFWSVRALCAIIGPSSSPMMNQIIAAGDYLGMNLTTADASAALVSAFLLSMLGAGVIIPTYFLARMLAGERTALYASCLAASMPGLLILGASPDLMLMTIAAAVLCRSYAGYRGSTSSALLAGLVFALGTFFSLGLLALGLWLVLWGILGIIKSTDRRIALKAIIRVGVISAASFLIFYLALSLCCGYRPLEVAMKALGAHHGVTTEAVRTYWKWVLMNPVECLLFAGVALSVAAAWAIPSLRSSEHARLRGFIAAWMLAFLIMNLSGTVRGEVGRIWMFLLWPLSILAAASLARRNDSPRLVPLLVLLQVMQALIMKSYLTIYSIL